MKRIHSNFCLSKDTSDTIARHVRVSPFPSCHIQLASLQWISGLTIFFFKHIFYGIYLFIWVFGMEARVQRLWLVTRGPAGVGSLFPPWDGCQHLSCLSHLTHPSLTLPKIKGEGTLAVFKCKFKFFQLVFNAIIYTS